MKIKYSLLLLIISMSSFSDISNNPSSWYIVTDQVMGGKSELEADFDDGVFSLKGYVTTVNNGGFVRLAHRPESCLLYTSPSPRDGLLSRMPSSA